MYPHRELKRLADLKAALRQDIVVRRARCVEAAARVARPVAMVDRVIAGWRGLSPVVRAVAIPLGLLAARAAFPRMKNWASFLLGVVPGAILRR